jgi:hypothetical protein
MVTASLLACPAGSMEAQLARVNAVREQKIAVFRVRNGQVERMRTIPL